MNCRPFMLATLFGSGRDLDTLQMTMRAVVLFAITLALIRIAGMRSFGRKSSFDSIIVIMLGAVLSRPVVGASPFGPTVAAATTLVVLHRLVAILTSRSRTFERLVKGAPHTVYRDGHIDAKAMARSGLSSGDLDEAIRSRAQRHDLAEVAEIVMETSGELTVVTERHGGCS